MRTHSGVRVLMENGKWLLANGQSLPNLAEPPKEESISYRRSCPKRTISATDLTPPKHGEYLRYEMGCICQKCVLAIIVKRLESKRERDLKGKRA